MRATTLALLLATLLGCDSNQPPPPAPAIPSARTSWTIRAGDGGTAGNTTGAQVTISPNAVDRDVDITLTPKPPDVHTFPGVHVVGSVWSIDVNGKEHFTFRKPVRLAVPFDRSRVKATVSLSRWQNGRWENVPGSRVEGDRVVADVKHFSDYGPTQDHDAGTPDADPLEAARKQFLKNEFWYGSVHFAVSASWGHRNEVSSSQTTLSRSASMRFRLKVGGTHVVAAALEETMKKSGMKPPPETVKAYEQMRNQGTWITPWPSTDPEDQTKARVEFNDGGYRTDDDHDRNGNVFYHSKRTGGGSDTRPAHHKLEIDVGKGTYSLSLGEVVVGKTVCTQWSTWGGRPWGKDPPPLEDPARFGGHVELRKLPSGGGVIAETIRFPPNDTSCSIGSTLMRVDSGAELLHGTLHGTITWTLSPVPFEDVELVITPDGYDQWMPRGGRDANTVGNSIPMKATLRARGGGSAKAKMKSLVVQLEDVSREPGVCLNVPTADGATTRDLKLRSADGTIEADGARLTKEGEFTDATFAVDCYDWGAWGRVTAHAILTDGRPVWGTLDGDPAEDEARLPKRDAKSKVADAWKKDMGVEGAKDDEDTDKQKDNKNDGDGLTLYEEYRGLIARGRHTREHKAETDGVMPLSPRKKDLILHNTIGDAALAGLEMFEKASAINIVLVNEQELPESRRVNVNAGYATAVAQHGLRLFNVKLPEGTLGESPGSGSARGCPRVQVDLAQIKKSNARFAGLCRAAGIAIPYAEKVEVDVTVAHEVAHGLAVEHHGADKPVRLANTTVNTSSVKVYDWDGKLVTTPTAEIIGRVEEPGNASSGDVNCIMCYNNTCNWSYSFSVFCEARIIDLGRTFCTSRDAKGPNAQRTLPGGGTAPGIFGPAGIGNCMGQMRVRDR